MALSWLNALEQLQSQFKGLAEVEKFAEKDFQWVDDVCAEATALFQKDNEEKDDKNNDANEEDPNESGMGPVLLPQTPRVKKDRAERLRIKAPSTSNLLNLETLLPSKPTTDKPSSPEENLELKVKSSY
jgi:hypothetical protein